MMKLPVASRVISAQVPHAVPVGTGEANPPVTAAIDPNSFITYAVVPEGCETVGTPGALVITIDQDCCSERPVVVSVSVTVTLAPPSPSSTDGYPVKEVVAPVEGLTARLRPVDWLVTAQE